VAAGHGGAWRTAQPVPGLFALNQGWAASIAAISCDPSGTCTAGGSYHSRPSYRLRPFVVTEADGRWGSARPISGGSVISTAADSADSSIGYLSCTAPGDCTAAGASGFATGIFVATEQDGRWGQPEPLPGLKVATSISNAQVTGLSCAAPGRCVVAGFYGTMGDACGGEYNFCYEANYSAAVPFVVSQVNGTWRAPRQIPGIKALNHAGIAVISALSCTPGGCAFGGFTTGIGNGYATGVDNVPFRAFIASEAGGTWNQAVRIPGLAALASAQSEIDLVTCGLASAPGLSCIAIGDYQTQAGSTWRSHVFMTAQA